MTAVIGPNAAGKSTLFKRIAGPDVGTWHSCILSGTAEGKDTICYMPQDTGANAVLTVYESMLCSHPSRVQAGKFMTANYTKSTVS